ncbi:uncharacterized protein [Drosophila takahashii]|uniref:uncharacterized protein n=1 Tax=Drosophila takahashii TaxID=29030 RepID=UPI001CF84495|nr:probable NOT transcription complex subunit VIP2 [Drosophila takahashii]
MKRHITNIFDDKEKSPRPPTPPLYQSPISSPEPSPIPNGFPILYVDVVKKNKPNVEILLPPPPPQVTPPPEFSIFREDFPALPGTTSLPSSVPNWSAMPRNATLNEGGSDVFIPKSRGLEEPRSIKYLPQFYDYLANPSRFDVSLIFGKQFLQEGVRQRALNKVHKMGSTQSSGGGFHPPPGFENSKIFARLNTNNAGMPLGGVNLEVGSPLYDRVWMMNAKLPPSSAVEGSFGMLGLARKLGSVQRNPLQMTQLFGNRLPHNLVPGESFAGPFEEVHLNPHEMSCNIPVNYLLAGRLNLQHPKMEEMQVELLFYFFYTYTGDMMQMLAAAELAERGWRYHKFERFWIKRQADNPHYSYRGFQESGEYNYFNMCQWKILPRHFQLEPEQLERTLSKEELFELHGYHPQMTGM